MVGGDKDERWDGERVGLRELAAALGVARWVDFRGPQPQAALPDYYAAADLCVMPSLYESFGMVALEAMACGVPVIGSRVGGLKVTVQDDVTGLLVPEGDTAALAAAIAGLLPRPRAPPAARRRGGRARQALRLAVHRPGGHRSLRRAGPGFRTPPAALPANPSC